MKNNLSLVSCGCAIWSINVKEEHKVHSKIFGQKKDELSGQFTDLHNKEAADK
jgi:hypothetical protein